MQSATGFYYLAVVTAFTAEVAAKTRFLDPSFGLMAVDSVMLMWPPRAAVGRCVRELPVHRGPDRADAGRVLPRGHVAPTGPHCTPLVFAYSGGRLWLTTSRRSVKTRAWKTDPSAAGIVRHGGLTVAFTGTVKLYDALDPGPGEPPWPAPPRSRAPRPRSARRTPGSSPATRSTRSRCRSRGRRRVASSWGSTSNGPRWSTPTACRRAAAGGGRDDVARGVPSRHEGRIRSRPAGRRPGPLGREGRGRSPSSATEVRSSCRRGGGRRSTPSPRCRGDPRARRGGTRRPRRAHDRRAVGLARPRHGGRDGAVDGVDLRPRRAGSGAKTARALATGSTPTPTRSSGSRPRASSGGEAGRAAASIPDEHRGVLGRGGRAAGARLGGRQRPGEHPALGAARRERPRPGRGLGEGSRYTVVMAFMGVKVTVRGRSGMGAAVARDDPAPRTAGRHDQHHRVEAPSRPACSGTR